MHAYYRITELPWTLSTAQDEKFRRLLRKIVPAILAFALVIPLMPVTKQAAESQPELPPQLAKLLLERRPVPPPVVKPVTPPPPATPQEAKARPQPRKQEAAPAEKTRQARADVSGIGVAAFADELRDLRENTAVRSIASASGLSGSSDASRVERSMITSPAGRSSGGINTAALSRDTGGSGLAGRATTRVAGSAGSGAGGGGSGLASGNGDADGRLGARSREEIELVFDKNKAAIFALYNRALRQNPLLRGKLVLKLTIAPSGEVTACEVVSSELGQSEFERKLVQRVKMFDFGAKDVSPMTTTKPIDFFPA